MKVKNDELVLVRGINDKWLKENFSELWIGFGGTPQATPKEDAYYVGLYIKAPVSKITHVGIVDRIEKGKNYADFYLKALIKLKKPIKPSHPIRKHENWKLTDLGLTKSAMDSLRLNLNSI